MIVQMSGKLNLLNLQMMKMNEIDFIEKYCKIYDRKSKKLISITLTEAQKKFLKFLRENENKRLII